MAVPYLMHAGDQALVLYVHREASEQYHPPAPVTEALGVAFAPIADWHKVVIER